MRIWLNRCIEHWLIRINHNAEQTNETIFQVHILYTRDQNHLYFCQTDSDKKKHYQRAKRCPFIIVLFLGQFYLLKVKIILIMCIVFVRPISIAPKAIVKPIRTSTESCVECCNNLLAIFNFCLSYFAIKIVCN